MDAGLLGTKEDLFNVPVNSVIAFARFDSIMFSMNFSCSGRTLYLLAFFTMIEPQFYSSSLLITEFSLGIIDMSFA